MAMSQKKIDEAKEMLLARLKGVCELSREDMLRELPQVCGFRPANPDQATESELIYVLMKFAILGILK